MAKLEDIKVGVRVKGVTGNEAVTIIAVEWHGPNVIDITYKDDQGNPYTQLLYRDEENDFEVMDRQLPWSFDADAGLMKLTSEAYRISLAHLFDPYLAVHTSSVEPLPHQISAVYQEMLPKLPLRYILADDPGAGKTIMTGLLIKELIARGDLKRCLIVCPGGLAEQWQDELFYKFHLRFEILTKERMETAVTGNIFTELDLCIGRLDTLARNEALLEKLKVSDWDLIVCDEAHKMSASIWGGEAQYTKRFLLGRLLSEISRNFLLLTATPHNGKEEDFRLFLSLVDPDRFGVIHYKDDRPADVSDIMRRLVKEELLKFDGRPLFPERRSYTVKYSLSPGEISLYDAVTEYVREEFNRAENLNKERKNTVGFALTVLQRRLASSPEAIYQSLRRRRERLSELLKELRQGKKRTDNFSYGFEDTDEDDYTPEEQEEFEENSIDRASAAATMAELEAEIFTLKQLENKADNVRHSGVDRKWDELSRLLQDEQSMFGNRGQREKLIIFTEHRDTLNYLEHKIKSLLGNSEAVVTIHGGMPREERRRVEELFKQDVDVRILIATDAAGEGINLQRAHLMINYDLPWNPNRLEQRFGRIHRIGQTEVCHLWNLVADGTREGFVFSRLFQKLEEERKALGGKVFDILGKVSFDNRSLKDLLIEAIRYGNDPEVRARLNQVVDNSINKDILLKLIQEQALTDDVMDINMVNAIREDMERMEAHKLQPYFIAAFFVEAFRKLGGIIRERECGRYQIDYVPSDIRGRESSVGFREPILKKYERICFDKSLCNLPGKPQAILVCPGHPLLEATIKLILERNANILKQGAVFVDENDPSAEPRLLFYIEDAIQDGILQANNRRRVISRHMHFVEMRKDGTAASAGYAPYLDYRILKNTEKNAVNAWMKRQNWLAVNIENLAKNYAIEHLLPAHFKEVKGKKEKILRKTKKAVNERMTKEIQYWDFRAGELQQKEAEKGIVSGISSKTAQKRADDFSRRLKKRLDEIEKESRISRMPPVVTGGALIIPQGLLMQITGAAQPPVFGRDDRKTIELSAMKAVMDIERTNGYVPKDVSADKCGYDVESFIPEAKRGENGETLRFIEVKGRAKGATTVTVTKNEILVALNREEQFILAVVEVDGDYTHTLYLQHPFKAAPDFSATSVNYDLRDLINGSKILYDDGKN